MILAPLPNPVTPLTAVFVGFVDHRPDEKTAKDFGIEGGSTLHLVLALRGGSSSR